MKNRQQHDGSKEATLDETVVDVVHLDQARLRADAIAPPPRHRPAVAAVWAALLALAVALMFNFLLDLGWLVAIVVLTVFSAVVGFLDSRRRRRRNQEEFMDGLNYLRNMTSVERHISGDENRR